MKKKKLKQKLSKTEKKLAKAKAEIKDLRSDGPVGEEVPQEIKVMTAP